MSDNDQLEQDRRAVRDLVHRVFDSYAQYDPALVDQCDVDDCTVWDLFEPDLVKGGRQAREEFRKKDMSDSSARGELIMNIEEPLIDVWGDFAVARYYLHALFLADQKCRIKVVSVVLVEIAVERIKTLTCGQSG